MRTKDLRIIGLGDMYYIQKPIRNFLYRKTGQWTTIGNADWAAVFSSREDAERQIRCWNGEDVYAKEVVG